MADHLLLEDGSRLLLEDGSALLLESSSPVTPVGTVVSRGMGSRHVVSRGMALAVPAHYPTQFASTALLDGPDWRRATALLDGPDFLVSAAGLDGPDPFRSTAEPV